MVFVSLSFGFGLVLGAGAPVYTDSSICALETTSDFLSAPLPTIGSTGLHSENERVCMLIARRDSVI